MNMNDADQWIQALRLQPHPEEGWFREVYRGQETTPDPNGINIFVSHYPASSCLSCLRGFFISLYCLGLRFLTRGS
mgnify:CR=1 FL=1